MKLGATPCVALPIALLPGRTIGYRGEQRSGGESVGQSPLKKYFDLATHRSENGFRLPTKVCSVIIMEARCGAVAGALLWLLLWSIASRPPSMRLAYHKSEGDDE
jgi:hypothetical protein